MENSPQIENILEPFLPPAKEEILPDTFSVYINTKTGEIRTLSDSLLIAWRRIGNPKANGWELHTPAPPELSLIHI